MDEQSAALVILSHRRFLYLYCASAFADEPDLRLLDAISYASSDDLKSCGLEDSGLACAQESIALAVAECGSDVLDVLKSEYTRLLLGPGDLPVPPWESVFRTKAPLLFQESTLAVREAYLKEGFRASGYPREADDHLGTELNFMAAMANRTVHACESGDVELYERCLSAQQSFLKEHLLFWIREFSDRLNELDGISSFYPSFASLAALVCERDIEVIKELLDAA